MYTPAGVIDKMPSISLLTSIETHNTRGTNHYRGAKERSLVEFSYSHTVLISEFNSKPDDYRVIRRKVMWQIKYVNREGQYFTSPKCTVFEFNAVLAAVVATAIRFSIIFVSGDKP